MRPLAHPRNGILQMIWNHTRRREEAKESQDRVAGVLSALRRPLNRTGLDERGTCSARSWVKSGLLFPKVATSRPRAKPRRFLRVLAARPATDSRRRSKA
jgi:hypothetical protein